jgi:hypothetical protein
MNGDKKIDDTKRDLAANYQPIGLSASYRESKRAASRYSRGNAFPVYFRGENATAISNGRHGSRREMISNVLTRSTRRGQIFPRKEALSLLH